MEPSKLTSTNEETTATATTPSSLTIPQPKDPNFIYPVSDFPVKSAFESSAEYPAIIFPAKWTSNLLKKLQHVLLNRPKTKNIYPVDANDPIPQNTNIDDNDYENKKNDKNNNKNNNGNNNMQNEHVRKNLRKMVLKKDDNADDVYQDSVVKELLDGGQCCRAYHVIKVSYEDFTAEEIMRKILPFSDVPSAFETVGHLAHVNLRGELLPFKYLIGKVLLDKNAPRIKTIVNKIGNIETEYRTFGMEVIAGEGKDNENDNDNDNNNDIKNNDKSNDNEKKTWSYVTVKEEGCTYEFDFRQVYWNSRLAGEHRRLVKHIKKHFKSQSSINFAVADLMAGVGPFAIPLTRDNKDSEKGALVVYANDLNPESYKYLQRNKVTNKCEQLECFNMDARAFCHYLQDNKLDFDHVIMNLPATAPEFLDAFRGYTAKTLPWVHVYCFAPKDTDLATKEGMERCSKALGVNLDKEKHNVSVHIVRDVAPKKNMLCVTFKLPEEVRELEKYKISQSQDEKKRSKSGTASHSDDGKSIAKRPKTS